MISCEIDNAARQQKLYQNMPLVGPDLDDVFYVFAVQVNSESSTGKRKLTCGEPYYLLDGFKIQGGQNSGKQGPV